jgi:hypothetical protein
MSLADFSNVNETIDLMKNKCKTNKEIMLGFTCIVLVSLFIAIIAMSILIFRISDTKLKRITTVY